MIIGFFSHFRSNHDIYDFSHYVLIGVFSKIFMTWFLRYCRNEEGFPRFPLNLSMENCPVILFKVYVSRTQVWVRAWWECPLSLICWDSSAAQSSLFPLNAWSNDTCYQYVLSYLTYFLIISVYARFIIFKYFYGEFFS